MTLRFRRSFKVLPGIRLNLSKRGVSTSIGVRGAHVTLGRTGVRTTVGIPGTGLSETELHRSSGRRAHRGSYGNLVKAALWILLIGWLVSAAIRAHAASVTEIKDIDQRNKLLASIPAANGQDLRQRLHAAGAEVTLVTLDKATIEDERESPDYHVGDKIIKVYTKGHLDDVDGCEIWTPFELVQHHGQFIPLDRTGNFLLKGICKAPN